MITANDTVLCKYVHKLADVNNKDAWFTEMLPFREIDKLVEQGYVVSVEHEHQVMNTEDNE